MGGNDESSFARQAAIPPCGLSVIVDKPNPLYDIIFVHGLNGHLELTWTKSGENMNQSDRQTTTERNEKHGKLRKWSSIRRRESKKPNPQDVPVFWPRDLAPQVASEARILAYGYDSRNHPPTSPPASTLSIGRIAHDFLVAVEARRRDELDRPIIFVAHSLGGMIVKEALRQSSSVTYFRSIFESTSGLIFFGTPHFNANPRESLRRFAIAVTKAMNDAFSDQVIDSLLPSSKHLQELSDTFVPMSRDREWVIHSFQERYGIQRLGGEKVVEDSFSMLNMPKFEIVQHIAREHHSMCLFTRVDDPEFKKVEAALRRIIAAIPKEKSKSSKQTNPAFYEEQRNILLQSLEFDQADARQLTVKKAHPKTCKWLVEKGEFLDWLDGTNLESNRGFIWIKGNPGTGKSTLMEFALSHAMKNLEDKAVISFFFNSRGGAVEKSVIGLYRSLLFQIFTQFPRQKKVLDSLLPLSIKDDSEIQWAVEPLKGFLRDAILGLKKIPILCFIDALDECDETEVRDMISFFQSLNQPEINQSQHNFRVCFSSRHYPQITIDFGLSICLEKQEGHYQDITRYVATELKIGRSTLADEIRKELQNKASGNFIWVVLVVGILKKEYDRGNVHTVRQRLRYIPSNLNMLFQQIFRRDNDNPSHHLLCIQWLLFARTPLTPEQLYFAIRSGFDSKVIFEWDPEKISKATIERFILNSSKGVAEITKSDNPTVQFIHESVRDFLLKEDGFITIWPQFGEGFEGWTHDFLKMCCLNYNQVDLSKVRPYRLDEDHMKRVRAKFPFLEYSIPALFYHADLAEKNGIDQKDFLKELDRQGWITKRNFLQAPWESQYSRTASLPYILAESNTPHLIRNHFPATACLVVENERYGCPLIAAIATQSTKARAAFYRRLCTINSTEINEEKDSDKMIPFERSVEDLFTRRRYTFDQRRTFLSTLAEAGDVFLVSCFLSASNTNADVPDIDTGRTPLSIAAKNGHYAVAERLLEQVEVDPDFADKIGRTPLSWAASNGHKDIVDLLLPKPNGNEASVGGNTSILPSHEFQGWNWTSIGGVLAPTGVNPDSWDHSGRTPLSYAAEYGSESIVQLLLETWEVGPDSMEEKRRTPLSYAAEYGHEAVVRLLLATGKVEPDVMDSNGMTPLSHLTARSHPTRSYEAVVRLLLETGNVDPNARDRYGETPLSRATKRGNMNIVKLLKAKNGV